MAFHARGPAVLAIPASPKNPYHPDDPNRDIDFCGGSAAIDHRLEQRILSMKPEHETRRKIIREWMSLPKDKRQTEEQAKPFAKKAMERIPSSGDPYRQIMRWLLPRIGKPRS